MSSLFFLSGHVKSVRSESGLGVSSLSSMCLPGHIKSVKELFIWTYQVCQGSVSGYVKPIKSVLTVQSKTWRRDHLNVCPRFDVAEES